jgi:hypothetical protein
MDAHNPSRDEAAPREEQSKPSNGQANAEAASKAQAAAQAKTEELRNALQTKASRAKAASVLLRPTRTEHSYALRAVS